MSARDLKVTDELIVPVGGESAWEKSNYLLHNSLVGKGGNVEVDDLNAWHWRAVETTTTTWTPKLALFMMPLSRSRNIGRQAFQSPEQLS